MWLKLILDLRLRKSLGNCVVKKCLTTKNIAPAHWLYEINSSSYCLASRSSRRLIDLQVSILLLDFVHLIKNDRNNWLTQATGELNFHHPYATFTAQWSHLLQLHKLECNPSDNNSGIHGLSKLSEVAAMPKPIERQNVSTCLKVFSDESVDALKVHPGIDQRCVQRTHDFVLIASYSADF